MTEKLKSKAASTRIVSRSSGFTPAYQHIENDLRRKVKESFWAPGVMLPSRDDLAQQYNVARGTVQRAVGNLVAEGILRTDNRRGTFVPSSSAASAESIPPIASSPKSKTRQMVALIMQMRLRTDYPPILAIMQGINKTLTEKSADFQLVMFNTWGDNTAQEIEMERHALETVAAENFPAAVLWSVGGSAVLPQLDRLQRGGVPLIFIDRSPQGRICDFIGVDNYNGAREAVEYLLSLGHRRIAHLTTEEDIQTVHERISGYRDALNSHKVESDPALLRALSNTKPSSETMQELVTYFFELESPPTALFVLNDGIAHSFIATAQEMGYSVPDDISVVGFDDLDQYTQRIPFLTTIRQPFEQIGRRAAELLLHRLSEPSSSVKQYRSIELPTRLIIRDTCRPLTPGDY